MRRASARRALLMRLLAAVLVVGLVVWAWQHRLVVGQALDDVGVLVLGGLFSVLVVCVPLSALGFALLIRSMGYRFAYMDGYHSLNLSQIATVIPGKVWGFVGLLGLLCSRGMSKPDSLMAILLHALLMLSSALVVGASGIASLAGWGTTLFLIVPAAVFLMGRRWLEALRLRFLPGSSPLPSPASVLVVLAIGVVNWALVALCFALLVFSAEGCWPVSPVVVASVFPSSYVAGYVSLVAPAGLGVREGMIGLLLGPSVGTARALTLAIVFRVIHMAAIWLNVAVTLVMLSFRGSATTG